MNTYYIIETSYVKKEVKSVVKYQLLAATVSHVYKLKAISKERAFEIAETNCNKDSSFMALTKKEYKHLVTTLIGGI